MRRVPVSSEERVFIQERIDRFADEAPEELRWQLPHVLEHRALPLYIGWTETAGIRPDGELARWSTEDWPGAFELGDTWEKVALVEGAERYPILRRLIPPRPANARDCETCKGSGRFPQHAEIICQCGGVGWVDGERRRLGLCAPRWSPERRSDGPRCQRYPCKVYLYEVLSKT